MKRIYPIVNVVGMVLAFFAMSLFLPMGVSWLAGDGYTDAYTEAMFFTLLAGGLTWLATLPFRRELKIRDGFLLVVLIWTILPAFATMPLIVILPDLSFTDAYFETVSGMTTTGATVLSGLDSLPISLNIWRGLLQWLGGMGIIVLVVAVLPLLGIGGRQMYKAETPGPMKDTKLTPRIAETAKGLWLVYTGFTAACFATYWALGMTWEDALMHAFTTLSSGGFSSHDASFAYFDSVWMEMAAIFFMLVSGINFASHFLVFRRRSLRPYWQDPEFFWVVAVMLGFGVFIGFYLWGMGYYHSFWTALRESLFNTVSIATTTGYATTDFNLWPIFAPLLMLFLSSFSTASGSTGGGIKMIRAMVLFRQSRREFFHLVHPNVILPLKIRGHVVPNNIVFAVLAFFFIYIVSIVILTLLLTASGLEIVTAFTAVVTCLDNTGPGLHKVGPATTFAILNDFQTWVLTVAMLMGRLELFTFLTVFLPAFWRK